MAVDSIKDVPPKPESDCQVEKRSCPVLSNSLSVLRYRRHRVINVQHANLQIKIDEKMRGHYKWQFFRLRRGTFRTPFLPVRLLGNVIHVILFLTEFTDVLKGKLLYVPSSIDRLLKIIHTEEWSVFRYK